MVLSGVGQWLLVGIVVGVVGGIVMDVLMTQQEDGFAPARVVVGVLTGRSPATVPFREVVVVHHVASGLVGALYGICSYALAALVPIEANVGGVDLLAHVIAVTLVVVFIYGFFTAVVLPRVDEGVYEERATAVHGQWLRATVLFGAIMLLGVPALTTSLV